MNPENVFFPFDSVRESQDKLMSDVTVSISKGTSIIAHAPTGLGKTAATLCPALAYALKHNKTAFFLTSRHTQHYIAVETLKDVKKKFGIDFTAVDLIGKRWMCPMPGTNELMSGEFSDYCKALREDNKCRYFAETKNNNKPSVRAKRMLDELRGVHHNEELVKRCAQEKLCPYEMATMLASKASIIICDYYYLFNQSIQGIFLTKIKKELEDAIIIVDEGHNLPTRVRDLLTERLTNVAIERAISEAKKYGYKETKANLEKISGVFLKLASETGEGKPVNEKTVSKKQFIDEIKKISDYDTLVDDFNFIGDEVREKQRMSYIGRIASFLEAWQGEDNGFARVLTVSRYMGNLFVKLSYNCLDPSLSTSKVIESSHSTILMSGTLTPTIMYRDLLGFPESTLEKEYPSPFPHENRLVMVIPETTTKYSRRSEDEYRRIAKICSDITKSIPGNIAIFFPSYALLNSINAYFETGKAVLEERSRMSKEEKHDFLEKFKSHKKKGAVLLGVASGSFGEGVDLPGDLLKAVVIVGLPLDVPDLETMELVKYYDDKFGKGWDYGYVLPAITRSLQNAGRCIRSETDRGAVVFLEERYALPQYKKCFPNDWDVKVTKLYRDRLNEFFGK